MLAPGAATSHAQRPAPDRIPACRRRDHDRTRHARDAPDSTGRDGHPRRPGPLHAGSAAALHAPAGEAARAPAGHHAARSHLDVAGDARSARALRRTGRRRRSSSSPTNTTTISIPKAIEALKTPATIVVGPAVVAARVPGDDRDGQRRDADDRRRRDRSGPDVQPRARARLHRGVPQQRSRQRLRADEWPGHGSTWPATPPARRK